MGTNRLELDCECPEQPAPGNENAPAVIRVLLIDDDSEDYYLTKELISDIPNGRFVLDWIPSYEEGLEAVCEQSHDVYLLDYRLGAQTGIDLLHELRHRECSGPVILLTGQPDIRTDRDALEAGAADFLEKSGLTPAFLERSIRYAISQHHTEAELEKKVHERTEKLEKVNAALRDADRRKDEFLSTLGHELRNPLAPMVNALEIMRLASKQPEVVERQREILDRQVLQMTRLVNDLLEVSRMVSGKLRLSIEKITLQDIIESSLDSSRTEMEKAKLTFTQNLPPEPIRINGDRGRLAQVFTNLLNNSAKYTEPGGSVSLTAELHPARKIVRVRIRDTGMGIPAQLLPRIFDLFTQVDRTLNRAQGGLGVGLAVVKKIVEQHGGTVWARSDGPGTGAEFDVELPLAD